jgi:hypothetical protein
MISGNTQCYHHVPLIILVVIAGTDKERPGCSKILVFTHFEEHLKKSSSGSAEHWTPVFQDGFRITDPVLASEFRFTIVPFLPSAVHQSCSAWLSQWECTLPTHLLRLQSLMTCTWIAALINAHGFRVNVYLIERSATQCILASLKKNRYIFWELKT